MCRMKVRLNNGVVGASYSPADVFLSNEQLLREQLVCSPFILLYELC